MATAEAQIGAAFRQIDSGDDPQRVEPFADLCPLVSVRQKHEATARGHNHRRAIRLLRPEDRDRGVADIGDAVRADPSVGPVEETVASD